MEKGNNSDNRDIAALLKSVSSKIDKLDARLTVIETSTTRMDNHISFVNTVYDQLRTPLDTLRRMVNSLPFASREDEVHYITLGQDEVSGLPPSTAQ